MADDDDDDNDTLSSLFICEEYVERTFTFPHLPQGLTQISTGTQSSSDGGATVQRLLCSPMSSTSHDLTGQIVWPAAIYLSYFIEYYLARKLDGKVVLELGAGCGLGGFIASRYCYRSIVTDGSDVVMRLLERNKVFLDSTNVTVSKLIWGIKREVNSIVDMNSGVAPDIVIGADVVLWPNQIEFLLHTMLWFLSHKPNKAKAYISYVVRAHSTTDLLFATAAKLNLSISKLDAEMSNIFGSGIVEPPNIASLQKHILEISIDKQFAQTISLPLSRVSETSDAELENSFFRNAAPC